MYKYYARKGQTLMKPWLETTYMKNVSISQADLDNGSPKEGDMIAKNDKDPNDKWLVAKAYFEENYVGVE